MNIFRDAFYKITREPKFLIYPTIYAFLNYYVMKTLVPSLEGATANVFAGNTVSLLLSIMVISYLYRISYIELILKYFKTNEFNLDIHHYINIKASFKLILADLLVAIITIAGLLLFFIPGIMWISAIMLYSVVLVANKEMSVTDILKISLKTSKGYRWSIFFIILIVSIPNIFLMSLPYLLASLIDGFISTYVLVSLTLIYLESSKKNI